MLGVAIGAGAGVATGCVGWPVDGVVSMGAGTGWLAVMGVTGSAAVSVAVAVPGTMAAPSAAAVSVGAAGWRVPVWAVVAASVERSMVVGGAAAIAAIDAPESPGVSASVLAMASAATYVRDGGGLVPAWHTAGSSWASCSLVG